jgi:hypothetical protein
MVVTMKIARRQTRGTKCDECIFASRSQEKAMSHDIFSAPARGIPKTLTDPHRKTLGRKGLRKGDAHKDRSDMDKQVGVWQHKNYLLCSVLNTALHVIDNLRKDTTINFCHVDKKKHAT